MKQFRRLTALLPCLLMPSLAIADVVDDIRRAHDAGHLAEALQLALTHLLEKEGDPDFDYEFGVVAIDAGRISQGVFALERVLIQRPNDPVARLELARGYFLLEQFERARQEFEAVLAVDPPEAVAANIRRFLNLIRIKEGRYQTTAKLTLDLDRGWDGNVNSAPFSPTFSTPVLGVGTLGAGSTQLADWYTEVNATGSVTLPVAPGRYLGASLELHHRANDEHDQFDTDAQTLGLSFTENVDQLQTRITLRAQEYDLDHSPYRRLVSLSLDAQQTLSAATQLTGFASYAVQRFPGLEVRESDLLTVGAGVAHSFELTGRPVGFFSAYLGQETPRHNITGADAVANRQLQGISAGAQWTLSAATSLTTTLAWQHSQYEGVNSLFLTRRRDDFRSAGITLKHLLDDRWSLSATLTHSDNDSNLPINTYERGQAALNLRYEY